MSLTSPQKRILFESDKRLRELERKAKTGDKDAARQLYAAKKRLDNIGSRTEKIKDAKTTIVKNEFYKKQRKIILMAVNNRITAIKSLLKFIARPAHIDHQTMLDVEQFWGSGSRRLTDPAPRLGEEEVAELNNELIPLEDWLEDNKDDNKPMAKLPPEFMLNLYNTDMMLYRHHRRDRPAVVDAASKVLKAIQALNLGL